MASLDKLAVRGIRSFDDKQLAVIEFFSPVTVIVGHNGSGKTTIIECLKYATTGDQPPNSRGGAFVHDPKIANEKEVKAQVKLRFHAANGKRMLAVRNLSVTVKKTGLTMKTLESILALDENVDRSGKRVVISTKCAEMDSEIPQLFGVSKAVLDNVIFCHQEDSYWPLAEPSTLKKKFDEIFEATRYTKALASMQTLKKERVHELKVEKEKLIALSKEKSIADKLKGRLNDFRKLVSEKELGQEELKAKRDRITTSKNLLTERGTKFREIYLKYEHLVKEQERARASLEEEKVNVKEVPGTDEELAHRIRNSDQEVAGYQEKKRSEEMKKELFLEQISNSEGQKLRLAEQRGTLIAEAKIQDDRLRDREHLIHEICDKYNLAGFTQSQLDGDAITRFFSKFRDLQGKQTAQFEQLKADKDAKQDDYNQKYQRLQIDLGNLRSQKIASKNSINKHNEIIHDVNCQLEELATVSSELHTVQDEIDEKQRRFEKIKNDLGVAMYDVRIAENLEKKRNLDDRSITLGNELSSLGLQADTRAKLDIKRTEVKLKTLEIRAIADNANARHRELFGVLLKPENMVAEVERLLLQKQRECGDAESEYNQLNNRLQREETTFAALKDSLASKKQELIKLEKSLKKSIEPQVSLEEALKEATTEVEFRRLNVHGSVVYDNLLTIGRNQKLCGACNRHMSAAELKVFEKTITERVKKSSKTESIELTKKELQEWEEEYERLQKLRPLQVNISQLQKEIPYLEKQVKGDEASVSETTRLVEEAFSTVENAKAILSDLSNVKQQALSIAKLEKDIGSANSEISRLASQLNATGFSKTADEVQSELNLINTDRQNFEKELQKLSNEKERQTQTLRTVEQSLHALELKRQNLENRINQKLVLEKQIGAAKKDINSATTLLKEIDAKINAAQAPIETLQDEFNVSKADLEAQVNRAEAIVHDINIRADRLNSLNKQIEQFAKGRGKFMLQEAENKLADIENRLGDLNQELNETQEQIDQLQQEILLNQVTMNNLQKNLNLRKLVRTIEETQAEMAKLDIEETAKARRNFDTQFAELEEKETSYHDAYMHMTGELGSDRLKTKEIEDDLKEYKNVAKQYTDQLIKVKMSDMANNDLEKYSKALDHAIMKYHSLKMAEVNDTMKHLWNKTYQGTDIDGIKIVSDVEGGSSTAKRSYNYRVVMTKDQVEMDMRGRCSAGQKMLASIIIRLALSDSFGQNCGILALDEPTNALDTENIDALADSLVDIINERKNHSNFQLIIITHDESFLRKLGQSDVMEFYWRVSRDSRQKSVIERQRFR